MFSLLVSSYNTTAYCGIRKHVRMLMLFTEQVA